MKDKNKITARRIAIAVVLTILAILAGRCFINSLSATPFLRVVELKVSVFEMDMKCESRVIGTVEHVACAGSNEEVGVFLLAADAGSPKIIGEITAFEVREGNTGGLISCRGILNPEFIKGCPLVELMQISEAVSRVEGMQHAWETGHLRLRLE